MKRLETGENGNFKTHPKSWSFYISQYRLKNKTKREPFGSNSVNPDRMRAIAATTSSLARLFPWQLSSPPLWVYFNAL
jgi:hypothetical protein